MKKVLIVGSGDTGFAHVIQNIDHDLADILIISDAEVDLPVKESPVREAIKLECSAIQYPPPVRKKLSWRSKMEKRKNKHFHNY